MNQGQTIFSQVIDFLPKKKFLQCVSRYSGNYRTRSFLEQAMALPDQFEISAVRKLEADPLARNIFIESGSFIILYISRYTICY